MFDSLKKKLSGWLGVGKKEEEEKLKKEIEKEKKVEKTRNGKEEKEKKISKKKKLDRGEEKEKKKLSEKIGDEKKREVKKKGEIKERTGKIQERKEEDKEKDFEKEDKEVIDVETREEKKIEVGEKEEKGEKEGGWLKKWWKKKEEIKVRDGVVEEKKGEDKEGSRRIKGELGEKDRKEVEEGEDKEDEKDKVKVEKSEEDRVEVEIKEEINVGDEGKEEEETKETPKEELKEELEEEGGFFARLKNKLTNRVLKKEEFEEIFPELEFSLLENNVALSVVDKIKDSLLKDLVGINVKKADVENKILESLKSAILKVLVEGEEIIEKINKDKKDKGGKGEPYVILFFGINGSGKTTSIAKIAYKLKKEGISCVLAAGDTFRAASIEQLEKHAEKVGVPIIKGEYGKDPASVGFDAVRYAKKNKIKVVLIDTAGRMYTKSNLMKEMEKIVKVTNPDLKIFVGESITGNDATEQAKIFNETAGIDGIILTKADVDEKAGAILSVGFVTGKPIFYLGVGQSYEDLKEFKKKDVLKGLGL